MRGVKQGCPMSAVLFNFYINPIIKKASAEGSTCLGYMDDLGLIFNSEHEAQSTVDQMSKAARALGMSFNIDKCGILNSSKSVILDGVPIPATKTYKYLGDMHWIRSCPVSWKLFS